VRGEDAEQTGLTRGIGEICQSDPVLDQPRNMSQILQLGQQSSWMKHPKGFVVLAACEEHQVAAEIPLQQHSHGLLTYSLLKTLDASPVNLSSQSLYERLCVKVQDYRRDQTPYLVGNRDRFFFSEQLRARVQELIVQRVNANSRKDIRSCVMFLSGGQMHGLIKGSEYAILPWGFDFSKQIVEDNILARVKVAGFMNGEARAFFVHLGNRGLEPIVEGCPAVLQKLPLVKRSAVYLDHRDSLFRANFEEAWLRNNGNKTWLVLNEKDNNPNSSGHSLTVTIDKQGRFRIYDQPHYLTAALEKALRPLPADHDEVDNVLPRLIHRLEHLARFHITKTLGQQGIGSDTPRNLISAEVDTATECWMHESGQVIPPADLEQRTDGTYDLNELTMFRITIHNKSSQPLSFVILNCSAEFKVEHLYPPGQPFRTLAPNDAESEDFWIQVEPDLLAAAEENGEEVVETFKVFASTSPRHLDSLQMKGLKEMEEMMRGSDEEDLTSFSDLDDLLDELDASRQGHSESATSARDDWEVVDIKFRIKPRWS